MKYRHERMVRAREARKRQRLERQREMEALLRNSMTRDEKAVWELLSDAVGRVS